VIVDWAFIRATALSSASALAESYSALPVVQRYAEGFGTYNEAGYRIRTASSVLRQLAYLAGSSDAQLAANPTMILIGNAGTGKTHFLCDVVERAHRDGNLAVMMLSEQFGESDPLGQIIQYSGLACTSDEFLGALDSLALASGRGRSLLIIDALNEGPSDQFWQLRLTKLMRLVKKYPRVGLIVSLRTDHQATLLDDAIRDLGVIVEHDGFGYALFEAQRIYFAAYNIQPAGPLLSRDYENPLYLKTLCQTLEAEGLHAIPIGHRSIIELFSRYIAVIGKEIAIRLGEDPNRNSAGRAIAALADAFGSSGSRLMPHHAAETIVNGQQQFAPTSFEKTLFRQLFSADVLAVTSNNVGERFVRFMFEKIADHAIAKRLIDNAIAAKGEGAALEDESLRAALVPELGAGYRTNTLAALVLQIPERLGIEIADSPGGKLARDFALNAMPSRSPRSVTARTAEIVSEALRERVAAAQEWNDGSVDRLLDDIVALATIPGHPLDASFLHAYLINMKLPERDAFWTVRINHAHPDHTLNRVLAWCRTARLGPLDIVAKVGLATIVCWMTASSNRSCRDHATKVLAQIMIGSPAVAERLLTQFRTCDDPYVIERLLCSIYGAALMTPEPGARKLFAQATYSAIFAAANVPVHILSREYARLTVQLAVDEHLIDIDAEDFSPPYGAKPAKLPKRDALGWRKSSEARDLIEQPVLAVRHSLGESGDFASYIVGTNSGFFPFIDTPLSAPAPVSRQIAERLFEESLSAPQSKVRQASVYRYWSDDRSESEMSRAFASAARAEKKLQTSLTPKQRKAQKLAQSAEVSPARVNLKGVTNWLYARVKSLGLGTVSLGDHDSHEYRARNDEHAVERIGKKYQWISYYELLARFADNNWMQARRWSHDSGYKCFDTTAAIGIRNIDPTIFLSLANAEPTSTWWVADSIQQWLAAADLSGWLRRKDLPDPDKVLRVQDENGQNWVCLDTLVKWTQPASLSSDEYEDPQAQIMYQLTSFLVTSAHAKTIEAEFGNKALRELRHVDEVSADNIFLFEFPASYFARVSLPTSATFDERRGVDMFPAAVHIRSLDRDAAAEDFATIVPSPLLAEVLKLGRNEGTSWCDASGVTAFDPSKGTMNGPSALLIREDVLARLDPAFELCWALSGDNRVIGGMGRFRMPGRIDVSGFWRLKSGSTPRGTHRRDWVPAMSVGTLKTRKKAEQSTPTRRKKA